MFPAANNVAETLNYRQDLTYRLLVSLWITAMSGIMFAAANMIFERDRGE